MTLHLCRTEDGMSIPCICTTGTDHHEDEMDQASKHFRFNPTPLTREQAIFQALGAASVCWENPGGAGVFDSSRCKEIGDALLAYLDEEKEDSSVQGDGRSSD
jgi:hypothetical protein